MPGEVKDPTRVIYNVTRSGLTNPSISWCHWLWASCAHHRLWSAVLHDTNMGARPLRYYAVGCLTTSRHKAVCRVYYRNRNRNRLGVGKNFNSNWSIQSVTTVISWFLMPAHPPTPCPPRPSPDRDWQQLSWLVIDLFHLFVWFIGWLVDWLVLFLVCCFMLLL